MRRILRIWLTSSVALLLVVFNLPLGMAFGMGSSGDGSRVILSEEFVGVVSGDQDPSDLIRNGVVVTWVGEDSDGSTRVLWASDSVELEGGVSAERVGGGMIASDLGEIKSYLDGLGLLTEAADVLMSSAGAYGGSGVLCSLLIPYPWVDVYANPNRARSSVTQTCSGHLEHMVEGWLHMNTFWVFYSTKDSGSSGWGSSSQLNVSLSHPCDSQGPKNWRNKGHGAAVSPGLVYFDGPTGTTNWQSLGCLG